MFELLEELPEMVLKETAHRLRHELDTIFKFDAYLSTFMILVPFKICLSFNDDRTLSDDFIIELDVKGDHLMCEISTFVCVPLIL